MLPSGITANQFAAYPPKARRLAVANIDLLRQLPPVLLVLLLKEVKIYDWKFPAEQKEVDVQLTYLNSLGEDTLKRSMADFARIEIPPDLIDSDWINSPELFSQRLSSILWATDQLSAFRKASIQYVNEYRRASRSEPLPAKRLTIVLLGQGVAETAYPLFRKLRKHGVYYTNVQPSGGTTTLLNTVVARNHANPIPFGHWYVDGGTGLTVPDSGPVCVSYNALAPLRLAVLKKIRSIAGVAKGPKRLNETLADVTPEQFGMMGPPENAALEHFRLSLFIEGSGTQFYSTTFVQWAARELLRRAQPLTILVRFSPRQVQRSMDEMLADEGEIFPPDPQGSLVDADMAAYYIWLNQRRLNESDRASFLVWFENHKEALMVSPILNAGTESRERISLEKMLANIT